MNGVLKAFLRIVSTLCIWGGPALAVLAIVGSLMSGADAGRAAVVAGAALYMTILALLIGGALRLLLSIDDRLERLEGNR